MWRPGNNWIYYTGLHSSFSLSKNSHVLLIMDSHVNPAILPYYLYSSLCITSRQIHFSRCSWFINILGPVSLLTNQCFPINTIHWTKEFLFQNMKWKVWYFCSFIKLCILLTVACFLPEPNRTFVGQYTCWELSVPDCTFYTDELHLWTYSEKLECLQGTVLCPFRLYSAAPVKMPETQHQEVPGSKVITVMTLNYCAITSSSGRILWHLLSIKCFHPHNWG